MILEIWECNTFQHERQTSGRRFLLKPSAKVYSVRAVKKHGIITEKEIFGGKLYSQRSMISSQIFGLTGIPSFRFCDLVANTRSPGYRIPVPDSAGTELL